MKNLIFHSPNYEEGIKIESKSSDRVDTKTSAEELYNALREGLPSGMYSQIEEKVVENFLKENCSEETLNEMKRLADLDKISFFKGYSLHKVLSGIIK